MSRTVACQVLLTLFVGGIAIAQPPAYGELILGDIATPYQVEVLNRATGAFRPLGAVTPQFQNWVTMAKNNTDMVVALSGAPNNALAQLTPAGVYNNIANLGVQGSPNGVDLHQDGVAYVVSTSTVNKLSRVVAATGAVTTICPTTSIPVTLNNVARDHDNHAKHEWVMGIFGAQGGVWMLDEDRCTVLTICLPIPSVSSVDPEPRTGHYVVTGFVAPEVRVVSRLCGTVGSMSAPSANAVKVDDFTGNYFVAHRNAASDGVVTEFTPSGMALNTWVKPGASWTSVDIYGSKQITGLGSAQAGTNYQVHFSFRGNMGGGVYQGALSFSQRPGIPVGAGMINLTPDALLFMSVAGILVVGFSGVLDANGNAVGHIPIPAAVPPDLTFYCSGLAIKAGVIQTGNTIGITVR